MFTASTPKKTTGLNFDKPKTDKEARIGDLKSENGKYYIFLETTIGKPRWHTHAELHQMAKEGKPIPEIAKKKIPSLKKVEEDKSKEPIAKHGDKIRFTDDEHKAEWIVQNSQINKEGKREYEIKYDNGEKGKDHTIFKTWVEQDDITSINGKNLNQKEKEAYELSVDEYINKLNSSRIPNGLTPISKNKNDKSYQLAKNSHKIRTQQAISEGKEVSPKAINDHEDIKKIEDAKSSLFSQSNKEKADPLSEAVNKKVNDKKNQEERNHRVFVVHKSNKPTTEHENLTEEEAKQIYEKYKTDADSEITTWNKSIYNDHGKVTSIPTVKMHVNKTKEEPAEPQEKKEYKFTTTNEFLKSKGLTEATAKKLSIDRKVELSKEYEQLQNNESKSAQEEFKQKSLEEKEQRRLEQEKNNKQFEDQLQMDEKDQSIEDRIDAKINDKRPLTPEEQKFFDENQYAPTGFKYDSQGNLIKQETTPAEPKHKELEDNSFDSLSEDAKQRAYKDYKKNSTNADTFEGFSQAMKGVEFNKDGTVIEPEHKVGDTKQEDGHTYRLNENHRWERVDEDKKEEHPTFEVGEKATFTSKDGKEYEVNFRGYNGDKAVIVGKPKDKIDQMEVDISQLKKIAKEESKPEPTEPKQEENQFDAKALKEKLLSLKPKLKFLNADERKAMEKLAERTSSAKNSQEKLEVAKDIDAFLTAIDKNIEDKAQRDRMVNPTLHAKKEDIHTIVEQKLDEKQENKSFKDAGKRVGGSKKEMAAIRAITSTDLDNMDNATAFKVVTKDRILPDIDVEQRRLDGEDAGLVFLKKKLHEAVSAKPANNPEARKAYVELIPKLFEKIDAAKSIDEIDDIGRNTFERLYSYRGGNKVFLIGSKDTVVEDYLGKTFLNLIAKNTDSAAENWSKAILYDAFPEKLSREKYEKYIEARTNNIKETKERLATRTPEEWERETKDDYMVKYTFNGNQLNKMKKEEPDKYAKLIQDHKDRVYKKLDNSLLSFENWIKDRPRYAPRQSDWTWNEKKERQATDRAQGEMKIHDNPPLAYIKRVNGREVKNSDVTPEAIKNNLGFNSVQFGNYVKDEEAKEHVKHFIASIYDLEDALGIDMTKINKMGNLSMAFGARWSGKAGAHYESMAKIINLTKTNGDGAVAHEFHHYFDHLFAGMKETGTRDNMFLSHQKSNDTPIGKAMNKVMDAIYKGDYVEEKVFEPDGKHSYPSIKRTYDQKGLQGAIEEIKRYRFNADYYKYLAKLEGKPITIPIGTSTTRFNKNAQNFKSDYWSRPLELFARATESFIQDKLEEKGMYNNYLVSGNDVTKPDGKWDAVSLGLTYPQGEERKKINAAIDELWKVAIKELNIGQDKPKEGKRVTSEVKIEKSFNATIHIFNLSKRFTFNGR
jgi:hypothetical protein